jgi:hypothetical protein
MPVDDGKRRKYGLAGKWGDWGGVGAAVDVRERPALQVGLIANRAIAASCSYETFRVFTEVRRRISHCSGIQPASLVVGKIVWIEHVGGIARVVRRIDRPRRNADLGGIIAEIVSRHSVCAGATQDAGTERKQEEDLHVR